MVKHEAAEALGSLTGMTTYLCLGLRSPFRRSYSGSRPTSYALGISIKKLITFYLTKMSNLISLIKVIKKCSLRQRNLKNKLWK